MNLGSDSLRQIQEAIDAAYAQAGLHRPGAPGSTATAPGATIVPLEALLLEQSLFYAELPRLTAGRAMAYLRQRAGVDLPRPPEQDEDLAGFLYAFPYEGEVWGCLLVRQEDIIERRRFSAAHELGHYLLHFLPLLKQRLREGQHLYLSEGLSLGSEQGGEEIGEGAARLCAQDSSGALADGLRAGLPRLEAEANRFAAELLMPEATCRTLWDLRGKRGIRSSRRLAQDLLVSPAAMHVRLSSLGLLT
jgi:hypothetical protein